MFIDPTGGLYTYELLRSYARTTARITRNCFKGRRGVWIAFASLVIGIVMTNLAITDYATAYAYHQANCNPTICSAATFERRLNDANYIGWAIYYAVGTVACCLIIQLALVLKLHDDIVWNIPTRRWFMQHAPEVSLGRVHQKLERLLRSTFWLTLLAGFILMCVMLSHLYPAL